MRSPARITRLLALLILLPFESMAQKVPFGFFTQATSEDGLSGKVLASYHMENANDSGPSSLNLTEVNTPTYVAGKLNNAVNFVRASSQRLTRADNSVFRISNYSSYSIAMWAYWPSDGSAQYFLLAKYSVPGGREFFISKKASPQYIRFGICNSIDGDQVVENTSEPAQDTWNLIVVSYNSSTLTSKIRVIGPSFDNANTRTSTNPPDGTSEVLAFGGSSDGFSGLFSTAKIDEAVFFSPELTDDEIDDIFNAGSGQEYPYP